MKKLFKNILIALVAVCTVGFAVGLTACNNGGGSDGSDEPQALIAPVISIDSEGVITWQEVEHADGYEIYEDDVEITSVTETSYKITQSTPGTYNYAVAATSTDEGYVTSPLSDPKTYTVNLMLTVSVLFPGEYTESSATVELYSADTFITEEQTVREQDSAGTLSDYGAVTFSLNPTAYTGAFTARIKNIAEGFVATWAHVSAESNQATITIIERGENEAVLGENGFIVKGDVLGEDDEVLESGDELPKRADYYFVSEEDSVYSIVTDIIVTDEENELVAGLSISVNGVLIVDTDQGLAIGSFSAGAGETVVISITGTTAYNFTYEIVKGEVPQYLHVMDHAFDINDVKRGDANTIQGSCTRYLALEEDATLTFFFHTGSLGTRTATLTVNGTDYVFHGGDAKAINFTASDEIVITITITGAGDSIIGFYVYPAE